ncbi:MAG TPA: copper resistance protein CopC [Rhizomicrobium sp.]|nr:copper resistance protein CopC [Rhizomicrobium sp.]
MKYVVLLLALGLSPAIAHIAFEGATVADGASIRDPSEVRLQFSENLEPGFSGAVLSDASGKPLAMSRAMGGHAITLKSHGLKPGAYTVSWHGMGHNRHRIKGRIRFNVVP